MVKAKKHTYTISRMELQVLRASCILYGLCSYYLLHLVDTDHRKKS